MFLQRFYSLADISKEKACAIYNRCVSQMKASTPYTKTVEGQHIITELEQLPTDEQQRLVVAMMTLRHENNKSNMIAKLQSTNVGEDLSLEPLTRQHIVRVLATCNLGDTATSSDNDTFKLTDNEQLALNYVGGALIRSRRKTEISSEAREVVDSWVGCLDEAQNWTAMQSRGGLIFISKAFSDLLNTFEILSGKALNAVDQNCNIRGLVMDCLIDSSTVLGQWENMCEFAYGEHSFDLLHTLVRKYSSVRCKAYIQSLNRKQDNSNTLAKHKPSASLRQSIAFNTK